MGLNIGFLSTQLHPKVVVVVDGADSSDVHDVSIFAVGSDWAVERAEGINCLCRGVSRRS